MQNEQQKKTAFESSAGTDEKQPLINSTNSITEKEDICNPIDDDIFKEFEEEGRKDFMRTIDMNELYDMPFEPRVPIIDGILHKGLYLFVGAPKVGKSFAMAQIGYCVSMGIDIWNSKTRQGTVLYLALEDNYQRLQDRLNAMFGVETTDRFYLAVDANGIGTGLEEQISRFVSEHKNTALVIIDTLQKVRRSNNENYNYDSDYKTIEALTKLAHRLDICIIVVHHTRKQEVKDTFDAISGTRGLLGAADGAFLLQKDEKSKNGATLNITGRDQPDQCLHLEFNKANRIWKLVEIEYELFPEPKDELLELIASYFSEGNTKFEGTATELKNLLGLEIAENVLPKKLNVSASKLYQKYNILYKHRRTSSKKILTLTLMNDGK